MYAIIFKMIHFKYFGNHITLRYFIKMNLKRNYTLKKEKEIRNYRLYLFVINTIKNVRHFN